MKVFFLIFMSMACVSCTSISIADRNGKIKIERDFGFTSINIANDAEMITAKITSFGYVSSPLGYNFGYSNQIISTSNDSCRIVVWVDENVNIEVLEKKLSSVDSVCFSK